MRGALFYAWGEKGFDPGEFERAASELGIDTAVIAGSLLNAGLSQSVRACPAMLDIILQPSPLCITEASWSEPARSDREIAEKRLAAVLEGHPNVRAVIIAHEDGIRSPLAMSWLPQIVTLCGENGLEPILLLQSPRDESARQPALKRFSERCSVWCEVNVWSFTQGPMPVQRIEKDFPARASEVMALRKSSRPYDGVLWQISGDRSPTRADGLRRLSSRPGLCEVEFADGQIIRVDSAGGLQAAQKRLHGRGISVDGMRIAVMKEPREIPTIEQLAAGLSALKAWRNRLVFWRWSWAEPGGERWIGLNDLAQIRLRLREYWS